MGMRFDAMVDVVRHHIRDNEGSPTFPNPRARLDDLLRRAALFEFPLEQKEIFPKSGKDREAYLAYVGDFLDLSADNGAFFLMPYRVTAVEDPETAFVMERLKDGTYRFAGCQVNNTGVGGMPLNCTTVFGGELLLNREEERKWNFKFLNQFVAAVINGERVSMPFDLTSTNSEKTPASLDLTLASAGAFPSNKQILGSCFVHDTSTSIEDFVEEIIYIMDPANFIIRKESPEYRKSVERQQRACGKKDKCPIRKTIMRPHYICLGEEDTADFLNGRSREPYPAHPVRGHFRTLMSERFIRMKGKRIYVPQYFTGKGVVEGENGWTYRVMVKPTPTTIIPYEKAQKSAS